MNSSTRPKAKIIYSAGSCFARYGQQGTSMSRIAASAGVNKAMIYYYFHSKEKLYAIVVRAYLKKMVNHLHYRLLHEQVNSKDDARLVEVFFSFWPVVPEAMSDGEGAGDGAFIKKRKMSWAALIRKVYEVDPLRCPECGGEMKIISFIEKCQPEVVEKILRHCGLWKEAVPRPPPVLSRVADGEPSYDYGYFDRVCI